MKESSVRDELSTVQLSTRASGRVMVTVSPWSSMDTRDASTPSSTTPLYSIQKCLSFFQSQMPAASSSMYLATLW